jgi:ADP-ribose pyrophosphatase
VKIEHWKKLESKVILDHPRLRLNEDKVELPNGQTVDYLRQAPAKMHSVIVVALNDKDEILLQREYSYPPNTVMWQLPGGGMDKGEDIPATAKRELLEESDVIAGSCEVIGSFYVNNRRSDEKQYVVLCTELHPETGRRDDEEFIESVWMPVSKLRPMIASGEFDNIYLLAALNIWFSQGAK